MTKEQKAARLAAEQAMGRKYNLRNGAISYVADMKAQGIEVEAMFGQRHTPIEEWKLRVGDNIMNYEEFTAMFVLMGYIKS